MKHSSSLRNTILMISIAALLVAAGGYAYLYHESSYFVSKVLNARKIISASELVRLQGKDIVRIYEETASERPKLAETFVNSENAVPFIKAIESVGVSSGATVAITTIRSTQPDPEAKDKTTVGYISVSVGVNGTWKEVMRALELFETLPYRTEITRMGLEVSLMQKGKTVERAWRLSLDIRAATNK